MLSTSEIKTLENYHFKSDDFALSGRNRLENNTLLCVKNISEEGKNYQILSTVKRTDVTSWELLKAYFGFGKLAGYQLDLKSISTYLQSKNVKTLEFNSNAYRTVHAIATRLLAYRKEEENIPEFWQYLATNAKLFQVKEVGLFQTNSGSNTDTLRVYNRALYLTPLTTIKHLILQIDLMHHRPISRLEAYKTHAWADKEIDISPYTVGNARIDLQAASAEKLNHIAFNVIKEVTFDYYLEAPISLAKYATGDYVYHHVKL